MLSLLMLPLRLFLSWLKILLVLLLLTVFSSLPTAAQDDLSEFGYWKFHEGTPTVSLYRHLYERAASQLENRRQLIASLRNRTDWQKRQAYVKAKLAEAIGPLPARTPLRPVITGTLTRQGFTVEKLYFESRPGYYVTAALFLPQGRSGRLPALVYCSGHSENGFRSEVYQHTILNYVAKGFVVLAFDPIGQGERRQYPDLPGKSSPTQDHSYAGTQSFVAGLSPASYFVWDGIRAIDYLVSRPEVDTTRIGLTGRSGGGTQTAYIAALDERIKAAAPECYITTTDKLWQSNGPQDAEQNLVGFLDKGLDLPDLVEVRAPKPTLIVSTTRDIFSIQGVQDTYAEARAAFRAFGEEEALSQVEDDAPHASTPKNREATYAFFQKYLDNPGSNADQKVAIFREEELYVTPTGSVFRDLNSESLYSLNQKYAQELVEKRKPWADAGSLRAQVISRSGYEQPAPGGEVVFSGRMPKTGYSVEKYLVRGAGRYYLPVLWLKPTQSRGKAVLLLDDRGKATSVKTDELADQLARAGYDVIAPDLSGTGELSPGYMKGGDAVLENIPLNVWYAAIQTHKSIVAVRAEEIAILTDFVQRTAGTTVSLTALANGTLTSDLLHAALFDNPFEKLALLHPLASYQSICQEKFYKPRFALSTVAGALPAYDLPDLVTALPAPKLLLVNPVDATDTVLGPTQLQALFTRSGSQGVPPLIRHSVASGEIVPLLLDWIK